MAGVYFLAYFICTSCLVAGQSINVLKSTTGHLRPDLPGQPNSILWTHNGNKVVEFDGSEQQVYSPYEDRITLDWHSAELNIRDLRFRDSGDYELEVDINNRLHASKYKLEVIDTVPMPKISCEMNKDSTSDTPDIKATLLCSAESGTPESLMKFEWRSGKQEKLQPGPKLEIPLGDKDDEEEYSCFVSSPLSSEKATFTAKECYNGEGSSVALAVCIPVILLLVIAVVGSIWYCRRRKKACFQSNDPEKQSPTADKEPDKNTAQDREKEPLLADNETPPSPRPGNVREKVKKIENMEKINKMNNPDERAPPERNRGPERGRGEHGDPGFTPTKVEQPPQQDPNHHDADKPEDTAKLEVLPSESSDLQKFNRPDPDESDEDKHTNQVSTVLSPGGEQPPQPDPNRHDADKPEETPMIKVLSSDSSDPKETKETDPAGEPDKSVENEGSGDISASKSPEVTQSDQKLASEQPGSESDIDEPKDPPTTPSLRSTSSLDQNHHADITKADGDLDQEKEPQKEEEGQAQKGLDKDTAQGDGDKSSLEAVSSVSSPGPADCLPSDDNTTLNDNTGPRKEEENSKEEGDKDEHKDPESATTEVEPLHQQYPSHNDADKPEENAEIKVSTSNSPDSEETTEPDPADELDKSVEDEHKKRVSTASSTGGEQPHQQDTNYHDVNKPEETPAIKVPPSDSSDPNVIPSDESVEDERSALRSPGYVKEEVKRIDKITVPGEQAPPERNTGPERGSDEHGNPGSPSTEDEQPPQQDPNHHVAHKLEETAKIEVPSSDSSGPQETNEQDPDVSMSVSDKPDEGEEALAAQEIAENSPPAQPESPTPEQNEEPEADQVLGETVSGSDSSGSQQDKDESSKSSEEDTPSSPDQKDQDTMVNKQDSTAPKKETQEPVSPAENKRAYVNDNESNDKIPSPAESQNLDSTIKIEEPVNTDPLGKSIDTPQMNPVQEKENQSGEDLNESKGQTSEAGTGEGKTDAEVKETPKSNGENRSED